MPDKHALKRFDDGTWRTNLDLPDGFELEFKITQGSWDTVEKSKDGVDIANRSAMAKDGLVLNIDVAAWAAEKDSSHRRLEPSLTGNIKLIKKFRSKVLGNERDLIVYLPESYDREPDRRFPVLYMQDGQNLFDRATSAFGVEWGADETAQTLIRSNKIEPLIIVGIYTEANRMSELTDTYSKKYGDGGKARLYAKFLVDEVKPFVDKTLPHETRPGEHGRGWFIVGRVGVAFSGRKVTRRCSAGAPRFRRR